MAEAAGLALGAAGVILSVGQHIYTSIEEVQQLNEQSKHLSELIHVLLAPMICLKELLQNGKLPDIAKETQPYDGGDKERDDLTSSRSSSRLVLTVLLNLKGCLQQTENFIGKLKKKHGFLVYIKKGKYGARLHGFTSRIMTLVPILCSCYQEYVKDKFTTEMKTEIMRVSNVSWEEKLHKIETDVQELKVSVQESGEAGKDMLDTITNYLEEMNEQNRRLPNVPDNLKIPIQEIEMCKTDKVEGSFGPIFKAKHKRQHVIIAKQFDDKSLTAKKEIEQLVRRWDALRHSNFIVQLYGYAENEQGQWLLILQYMPNGSLRQVLKDKDRHELCWKRRQRMALDCAEGVYAVHYGQQRPMLHRAVTSAKFLVDSNYNVKITDNGFVTPRSQISRSRSKSEEEEEEELDYQCPEKVTPQYKPTLKSEIYRLGIVFYEIASRMMPFQSTQMDDKKITQIFKVEFVKDGNIEEPPSNTPRKFKDLMNWCRRLKPEDRPTTGDVVNELSEICGLNFED